MPNGIKDYMLSMLEVPFKSFIISGVTTQLLYVFEDCLIGLEI